mmetsp:Transcript_20209/g.43729  ORF Transcript_20209/g.43729 Transcript_20209/m.43729 type:complete len:228 (+) Transcript_20209:1407-2090(+)
MNSNSCSKRTRSLSSTVYDMVSSPNTSQQQPYPQQPHQAQQTGRCQLDCQRQPLVTRTTTLTNPMPRHTKSTPNTKVLTCNNTPGLETNTFLGARHSLDSKELICNNTPVLDTNMFLVHRCARHSLNTKVLTCNNTPVLDTNTFLVHRCARHSLNTKVLTCNNTPLLQSPNTFLVHRSKCFNHQTQHSSLARTKMPLYMYKFAHSPQHNTRALLEGRSSLARRTMAL